jgi:hypothetical protein
MPALGALPAGPARSLVQRSEPALTPRDYTDRPRRWVLHPRSADQPRPAGPLPAAYRGWENVSSSRRVLLARWRGTVPGTASGWQRGLRRIPARPAPAGSGPAMPCPTSRRMRGRTGRETDNQLRPVLQQHAAVAFGASQPPVARAGPPLSAPVDRVTPVAVLRQTMTLTPQVRRMIRPPAAPSITTKCSPCRAASRSRTASTVVAGASGGSRTPGPAARSARMPHHIFPLSARNSAYARRRPGPAAGLTPLC